MLKKLSAMFVVLILVLITSCSVLAENLCEKSESELIDLYLQIQAELLGRSNEYSLVLNAGKYIVGTDMPAGSYQAECKGTYSSSTMKIFSSRDAKYADDTYIMAELYQSATIGRLDLAAGNVISITGSAITLKSYSTAQNQLNMPTIDSNIDTKSSNEFLGNELEVAPGKYQVGLEIPAGTYSVKCKGAYSMVSFNVYESKDDLFPVYSTFLTELLGNSEIGKIVLSIGNIVEISEGSVTLFPYKGVGK